MPVRDRAAAARRTLRRRVLAHRRLLAALLTAVAVAAGLHAASAEPPASISVLDVITAIDGKKSLFDCKNIRTGCAVFGSSAPRWATKGVCSIHAVMLEAEARMREVLAKHSLADLTARVAAKAPAGFAIDISNWLAQRPTNNRSAARKPARD